MNNETARPLTAEDLKHISVYSDPQFTPDGKAYVFVSTRASDDNDYVSQLLFQSLNEQKPRQWTFDEAKNSHPRFSPDGKRIVFQSTRSGVPQLWLIHTDGGEAKQLTTFKHGAVNPEWTKNGKYIIFSAPLEQGDDVTNQHEASKEQRQKEQDEKNKQPLTINRLKYKSDVNGFHDDKRTQIVLYDVGNNTFEQLTSADQNHNFEDVSPDGKYLLFSANLNEDSDYELTNDLHLLNLSTKNITPLTDGKGQYGNARFSPSGAKIACFGHEFAYQGATFNDLYVFDAASGERFCLSDQWDFQLGDAMVGDTKMGQSENGPVWSDDEKYLFFIGTDFGATGLYQTDLNGELTVLYKEDNHVFGFSYRGGDFILGISTPTNPCNFYQLANGGQVNQLTNANQEFLDDVALSEPETLTIKAEDGWGRFRGGCSVHTGLRKIKNTRSF
ncbi:TolB family protein [Lentibacillus sp. CBA3610]|uniref:TolB family protein n=1 Tax=Lentibacillus sp. CBA3610 TaxID=2518176 RepID=UPI00350E52F7